MQQLFEIIKNGEYVDSYENKNKAYYKILYNNTLYLISEYKNKIKIENVI